MIGDRLIRCMLVFSGLSPVFLLWAIRGVQDVPSNLWAGACLMLFVIPNAFFKLTFKAAKKSKNIKVLVPCRVQTHQDQLLTYLLAMLLPLIEVSFNGWRDALAGGLSLSFTAFLFYKMRLHYINIFLLAMGYSIFELEVEGAESHDAPLSFVVISRREHIAHDSPFTGYRLGGNVLMEVAPDDRQNVSAGEYQNR